MKSISQLTQVYYETLYPTLEELEKERKAIRDRFVVGAVIISIVSLFIIKGFEYILYTTPDVLIFIGVGYIMLLAFLYKFLVKDYKKEFKTKIIQPLVGMIDKNLHYSANTHISKMLFERSKLFVKVDKFSGDDYVKGMVDGIMLEFSDVVAKKKYRDEEGREHHSNLFQGLFIVAEFNKDFNGRTMVLPDTAQNFFGDLVGSWMQSNNLGRDELVKMDSIEFEKEFVVYATDQIEARYILSHTIMSKLLNLKKRSKHPLYVSFVGKHIHIAIEYNKDLFEPSVFHSLLEYKIAMEYVQTLHLAIGIVQELKLNQKLWSKR